MSLTVTVFSFEPVSQSRDGATLCGRCQISADMPFFNGHFPGLPLMPAAAQIEMIQALLQQHADWKAVISGGKGLKFTGRIQPDDHLTIRLQRRPAGAISFSVENGDSVLSKGILQLAGGAHD